ncbi:MAG: hypothetical protein GXP55_14505 [Deltaproteobacteria bacterium]|nr:hypothetical protein [Deltaproteobacteria bacterium]
MDSKLIRISSFLGAAFTACTLLIACGGGGNGTVFADAIWQVRCPPGLAGCSSPGDAHNVFGFDSEENDITSGGQPGLVRTTCTIDPIGDGDVAIAFSVQIAGATLAVRNAVVTDGGGAIQGTACQVTITDDSVTYVGRCGGSAPSDTQPCQLSNITMDPRADDGPTLQTSLLCTRITSPSDPTIFIRNVERGVGSPRGTPAPVRLIHCPGI